MSRAQKPGIAAHIGCALLALLMVTMTLLSCLTGGAFLAVSDRQLMRSAADAAIEEQTNRVAAAVRTQAETYGFNAAPVLALADGEAVSAYNRTLVDWWMALLSDPVSLEAPAWSRPEIADAVMADENYQAKTPSTQRRAIAVDRVEAAIEQTMERSALPIRTSLMHAGLMLVERRIPVRTAVTVVRMTPVLCAMAALLCALGMLACMNRDMRRALGWMGAALLAGALVTAGVLALAHGLDILTETAQMSVLLPRQLGVLAQGMGLRIGLLAGAAACIGAALMAVHHRVTRRD